MDTALTIVADVIIVISFPLHCRYLYVMLRKNVNISYLEYSFRATLTSIVIANLLYSIVFILVQEPAAYGLISDFYRSQSWWLGKITIMQSIPFTLATGIFHVVIATNRMSAILVPMQHAKLWSERRVQRILIVIWVVTVLECIPLIYPFEGNHYDFTSPIHNVGVGLGVAGNLPNLIYQGIAMGVGALMEIIAISFYIFIGFRMSRLKNLSKSIVSSTISAVLVSTGGFVILIVVLPDILAARLAGKAVWSDEIFYGLFKLANAYNNAVTPWVMLFYYRKIRLLIVGKKDAPKPKKISVSTMDTALTIITDVIIVVTFPLHCRYLYVMLSRDAQISSLEYAFRAALTNIVVANLLYSIVFILIGEPAAYGLFSDFYRSQSWWLGKIAVMQAVPIAVVTAIFHVLIAVNRLSALVFPVRHAKLWSQQRVNRILIGIWAVTIIECIPLIYPFEGNSYNFHSPIRSIGVALGIAGDLPNLIYQSIAMVLGGLLEVVAFIIYLFIGLRMSRLKNLPQSTITITVAAVLVSTGGFLIILVFLPDMLATRLRGKPFWSEEMFYGLFKLTNAYNNAVAPWVMLFYYKKTVTYYANVDLRGVSPFEFPQTKGLFDVMDGVEGGGGKSDEPKEKFTLMTISDHTGMARKE